ncbi:hypothetical protein ACRAWF_06680 [Streptomyces sp. L7]
MPLGRIVFPQTTLPAVRPAHHILDGGDIIVSARNGAAPTAPTEQADARRCRRRLPGRRHRPRHRPAVECRRHRPLPPRHGPGAGGALPGGAAPQPDHDQCYVVRIHLDLVTGIRRAVSD